jgi:hypothetical protein
VELVRAGVDKVAQGLELLRTALAKCEPSHPDGRFGIQQMLAQMEDAHQWMGARLALSEALDLCQKAETLVAFGQFEKARETLGPAQEFLGRVTAEQLQQFGFLKADHQAAQEKIGQLQEAIQKGGAGAGELAALPLDGGQWLFRLDPADQGNAEHWFAAEVDRSGWARISVPGFWEKSGVEGTTPDYDGLAWYARPFDLPPAWKGKKIVLHVGAVDDEAWVWLNGEFVGDHLEKDHPQVAWEEPFEFDVTKLVKWELPNEVVVRVNDTHLGGGIWKSTYLRADPPDQPAPGPGEVEIKTPGEQGTPQSAAPPPPTPGQPPPTPEKQSGLQPGWSVTLNCPDPHRRIQITASLRGYGTDPENSAGRPLTAEEKKYLADHRVGQLGIPSFTVGDRQLVLQNRYPGFLSAVSFNWDGYGWNYHSLDEATPVRDGEKEAVHCRGRVFCAHYGRFETWMRYEYEIALRADGLGCESLTLIPDHDTNFAPNRNGPPYAYSGVGCAVGNVSLALGRLPASFTTALLSPLPDVPAQALALDYDSDRPVWAGRVEPGGYLGACEAAGVYLALFVPPGAAGYAGQLQQFDAEGYPGDELQIALLPALVADWPTDSRNQFVRWFAVGTAADVEAAKAALHAAQQSLL